MSKNNSVKDNNLKNNNDFQGINSKAAGNYTKGAVQSFENKIVSETNYLEKVNKNLDK
jgi:hypothetical protein